MLQQICRTCLATCGELIPIFSNDYYVHNLPDKLLHTTRIEVLQDDDLPKMMCKKCIFLVDSLYCFKDQCEMAEIKLKKKLSYVDKSPTINTPTFMKCKAEDNSEVTSSEDEYQVEYVSEEARLEVENARRRSRNAKRKRNKKNPGIKVKSVEILPSESKDNIYKNISTSSLKYEATEVDEDVMVSSDDISSMYMSEDSKKLSNSSVERQNYSEQLNAYESKEHLKNPVHQKFQDESLLKLGLKRRIESNNSFNQINKVPKKVMFSNRDLDMEVIEISKDGKDKRIRETKLTNVKNESNTVVEISILDNNTEDDENYDINPMNKENNSLRNLRGSTVTYDLTNEISSVETQQLIELRMQNLINRVVLKIPEICAICLESFGSFKDVLKHKIEAHLGTKQDFFFCPICHEKFFSNKNLVEHLDDHTDVQSYICVLCSGNFYTEKTLRTHLTSHVDLRELKCQIDSKKFQRINGLLNHLDTHITSKQLVCTLCTEDFKNKKQLQIHIDSVHVQQQKEKIKCKVCGILIRKFEAEQHAKTHSDNFSCPYCERCFNQKAALRNHVFIHLGVHQFSCLTCEKTFSTENERTKHMQDHNIPKRHQKSEQHTQQTIVDRKKFRCRVCHEILISRIAYGQHLKEKHLNAKQTSEILRELSESTMNDYKFQEQQIKGEMNQSI